MYSVDWDGCWVESDGVAVTHMMQKQTFNVSVTHMLLCQPGPCHIYSRFNACAPVGTWPSVIYIRKVFPVEMGLMAGGGLKGPSQALWWTEGSSQALWWSEGLITGKVVG